MKREEMNVFASEHENDFSKMILLKYPYLIITLVYLMH